MHRIVCSLVLALAALGALAVAAWTWILASWLLADVPVLMAFVYCFLAAVLVGAGFATVESFRASRTLATCITTAVLVLGAVALHDTMSVDPVDEYGVTVSMTPPAEPVDVETATLRPSSPAAIRP